jgi:hypothetical protein
MSKSKWFLTSRNLPSFRLGAFQCANYPTNGRSGRECSTTNPDPLSALDPKRTPRASQAQKVSRRPGKCIIWLSPRMCPANHEPDMTPNKTAKRNRVIFATFEAGRSFLSLREQHSLTDQHVRALLTHERHKRIVCPETFYRTLRSQTIMRPDQAPRHSPTLNCAFANLANTRHQSAIRVLKS